MAFDFDFGCRQTVLLEGIKGVGTNPFASDLKCKERHYKSMLAINQPLT
jgi:hypothetical protein